MANKAQHQFTTPVVRLVAGNLYEGRTTDNKGVPLIYKNGAKKGQPRTEWNFGIALPKTPGVMEWKNEPFLAPIWALGQSAFPRGEATRDEFSWKIEDGDDAKPNKNMVRNCDREGYPGNWIIYFSSSTPPRVVNANGTAVLTEKGHVKKGYYVQVFGYTTDNTPSETPGMYMNPSAVAFAAFGDEIQSGPDISQAGFGQNVTLPAGASAAPVTAGVPATGATQTPPAPLERPPLMSRLTTQTPPAPNADMRQVPTQTPPPPAPPAADPNGPPPGFTMLDFSSTYAAFIAAGWNNDLLLQHGKMKQG